MAIFRCLPALLLLVMVSSLRYVAPRFTPGRSIASLPNATLRDPTTALWDPVSESWHVYCTHVPHSANTTAGYPGTIWHWSLDAPFDRLFDSPTPWRAHGAVLNPSNGGGWDSSGVFTPGAVRDCNQEVCTWFLFYGGVQNQDAAHAEEVGLATATSPFGPFEKWAGNPVFSRFDPNNQWCTDGSQGSARVDEIKPTSVGGVRLIAVKSVCANFTALPVLYAPRKLSWGPPYTPESPTPLIRAASTCSSAGFEEPTILRSSHDGLLHFMGHGHGVCRGGAGVRYVHFVSNSSSGSLLNGVEWEPVDPFDPGEAMEPIPVPLKGDGVFGDVPMADQWIDFLDFELRFSTVSWEFKESTQLDNKIIARSASMQDRMA